MFPLKQEKAVLPLDWLFSDQEPAKCTQTIWYGAFHQIEGIHKILTRFTENRGAV
jgi:hypothetical protein